MSAEKQETRVYIPFDDGSSVSFDGAAFALHRRPLDKDMPDGPDDSKAREAWEHSQPSLIRALEAAWRRQREARRAQQVKQVYSPVKRSS